MYFLLPRSRYANATSSQFAGEPPATAWRSCRLALARPASGAPACCSRPAGWAYRPSGSPDALRLVCNRLVASSRLAALPHVLDRPRRQKRARCRARVPPPTPRWAGAEGAGDDGAGYAASASGSDWRSRSSRSLAARCPSRSTVVSMPARRGPVRGGGSRTTSAAPWRALATRRPRASTSAWATTYAPG